MAQAPNSPSISPGEASVKQTPFFRSDPALEQVRRCSPSRFGARIRGLTSYLQLRE